MCDKVVAKFHETEIHGEIVVRNVDCLSLETGSRHTPGKLALAWSSRS